VKTENNSNLDLVRQSSLDRQCWELLLLADESKEAIYRYISDCEVYVLQKGGESIGICAFAHVSATTVEIKNFSIRLDYQQKGFGYLLMKKIEKLLSSEAVSEVRVGTGDASHGAMLFYQKNDYEFYEIRRNFFLETYPAPIIENGVQLRHMIILRKLLDFNA
jgi:N-acetylglutamate synthase-like GNAT family acetyltransferase